MIQHNQSERALLPAASPQIAETLANARGFALLKARDYARAEPLPREAITIYERRNNLSSMASTFNDLGNPLGLKGDYTGSEDAYRKCHDIAARIFGPAHANIAILDENIAVNLRRYSVFLEGLADILRDKRDIPSAEKPCRKGMDFDQTNPRAYLPGSYARLSQFLYKNWQIAGGQRLLHKGLEYQRSYGGCLKNLNRLAEAETRLSRSYQIQRIRECSQESEYF